MAATMEAQKRELDNNVESDTENAKKKKLDTSSNDPDEHTHHPQWKTLEGFELVSVLNDDPQCKALWLHAKAEVAGQDGGEPQKADAVITLEKSVFDKNDIKSLLSSATQLNKIMNNDIYGTYESFPPHNGVKTTIIFPATSKHLDKFRDYDGDIITETAEDYRTITEPWIQAASFDMRWIYNILEKKKESEFIIFEDPDPVNGFILLPDLKWDKKSVDNMYISAIVHRHGIKSLRDLTPEHLPLLRNLLHSGLQAIEDKYGVKKSKVRAYFHYQPTYYHLHVHYNQAKHTAPGSNVLKAHLLTDVIENIERYPDYYQQKSLIFYAKENTELYKRFKDADRV